ncbi:hypothetical protein GCM10010251_17520 [Streptomyces aurantiogriseus]|uniref:Uncharacterized protein n=1 Tax=Streptomyces aurantiogriseus TaxID=66870 RepID=A0A918C2Q4_9ACTN|nr:hypothetical protein GCM10010251_17520 [Streptomyces aurantiogriseus]
MVETPPRAGPSPPPRTGPFFRPSTGDSEEGAHVPDLKGRGAVAMCGSTAWARATHHNPHPRETGPTPSSRAPDPPAPHNPRRGRLPPRGDRIRTEGLTFT